MYERAEVYSSSSKCEVFKKWERMGSELPEGELTPGLVTAASPAWSAVKAGLCGGALWGSQGGVDPCPTLASGGSRRSISLRIMLTWF